ncbi:KEOPS complex subunit Pcc1 [Methanoculleus sp. 7T]|jgi:hypothetical protein|uniref:KEOPS complex subunit Pcc1 n=1 Tax=Methanoculleus sp. 7T TaxID=2937282 RepID=UPI0020C10417|nr:KEOPS complex subunit Pcc1 [Methanoculleus sp. 7T]MCK8519880.1 hypothetical protein [Methanoculleus sp. 7T]
MIRIEGTITTESVRASCVAGALAPDNLSGMETAAAGNEVVTAIRGEHLRSVTASVDDYLMNLAIAEEVCSYLLEKVGRA